MVYDTVIFDLDGTLLNTLMDLKDSLNYVLGKNGFPERTAREVRGFLGNEVRVLLKSSLPEGTGEADMERCLAEFKARYALHLRDKTCPYDGVISVLKALAKMGVRTAIVSNKFDQAVKLLSREYFDGLVESAVGESETVRRKPSPDGVLAAMKELRGKRETTLYVGDSEVDVETAKNAGVKCAGVTWGFRDRGVLEAAGADYIIDRPEELLEIAAAG